LSGRPTFATPRFGNVAAEYEEFRVGYADAVWDHLAARCGLGPGADVVDVGCGTGLASLALADRGARVVGVDADGRMLEGARRLVGERARFLTGTAEALPLPDASADLAVAAQAAHWFSEPAASREIRRVLRPGGWIAYVWKMPAPDTPYTYLVEELLARLALDELDRTYAIGVVPALLAPGFEDYERAVFPQDVPYTVEAYVGFTRSRETVRQRAGDHRDELLRVLEERLRALEPSGRFVERNLAYVISARRTGE
jgi:ubiquinone/menaquinone biosynthesis C-methylase UbiE